jgi:hypothetical protein
MVRDQALFVSGLLSPRCYGPPVKPPQPSLGLSAAFGGKIDWQTSAGEDRYRRALYTSLAALEPVSVDGDVRRAQPRSLHAAPGAHQHAAASAGHAERSGLRRSGPGAGPADGWPRAAPSRDAPGWASGCAWRGRRDAEVDRLLKLYEQAKAVARTIPKKATRWRPTRLARRRKTRT